MGGKSMMVAGRQLPETWGRIWEVITRLPTARMSLWLFVLPLLLLLPYLNSFAYPVGDAAYSDLTISHYPNLYYLKAALRTWKEIPLWSSTILSGYPFGANPLSGLWYPFGWILLVLPLPMGFNFLVGLHLIWGGLGLYLLMRREGIGRIGALFAGISFSMLPKLFSHYGAGHLTLLFAISWTPLLLWIHVTNFQFKIKGISAIIKPGLILALIFLADVRWGAFAAVLYWGYSLAHRESSWKRQIFTIAEQTILALLLSAPLILPLIEFSLLSTRTSLNPAEVLKYSLPIGNLLGLIFPGIGGNHEWMLYAGGIVLILALAAIILKNENYNNGFWIAVLLLSLGLALGSQVPGMEYLAKVPFVSLLRVPSRSLFLVGLSLAALSGIGLEKILDRTYMVSIKQLNLSLFALIVFAIVLGAGVYIIDGSLPIEIMWGAGILFLGIVWIELRFITRLRFQVWIVGLFLIGLLDLAYVDLSSFQGKSTEDVFREGAAAAQYLSSQPGEFRTYSPSYAIPQHTAVRYGLELSDGVDPLQLASYANFMESATGVPRTGYSVTIPPFQNGDPKIDNAGYSPDAVRLGLLNVGYVVSDFALNYIEGLTFEGQYGDTYIYKNANKMPRVWVEMNDKNLNPIIKPAEIITRRANKISISAEGPGLLVASEIDYPGWDVWVDGEKKEIETVVGLLRAVKLEAGAHEILFSFQPTSVYLGMALFIGGLFYLLAVSINPKYATKN
jgi:hypothetical protein